MKMRSFWVGTLAGVLVLGAGKYAALMYAEETASSKNTVPAAQCADSETAYFCETTPEKTVRLRRGEKTIWELHLKAPEGKPYIGPLCLPDGRDVALLRPKDHVWHLGAWFSWKYLNGVNYWEPSHGKTKLADHSVKFDGAAAEVTLHLVYFDARDPGKIVLSEERVISFSAPDETGSYAMTSRHRFTAGEKDVKLDRTPPHSHGGGYAGLAFRMSPTLSAFELKCENGETEMTKIREKSASWIEYREKETGLGVRMTVLKGTPETRFYAQHRENYCFVNPCPVLTAPRTIPAGETLELAYEIHLGKR